MIPTSRPRLDRFGLAALLAAAVGLAAPLSGAGQGTDSLAALETRLEGLQGVERVRALARLTDGYRSSAPARAVEFGERALAEAGAHPDVLAEVQALNEMAWALMELGRYDEGVARAQEGLARARDTGIRSGEARAENNLGVIARLRGDYPQALDRFHRALEVYGELGDEAAVATALNNLSVVQGFDLGDYHRALENQLQALEIRQRLGDEEGIYQSYNSLGVIYDNLGDQARAVGYLERALEGWRALGRAPRIASTLNNLAGVHAEDGRLEQALELQRESLAIRRDLATPSGVAFSLASIGAFLTRLGRLEEAREPLEESLRIRRDLGERKTEAQSLLELARLSRAEGRIDEARRRLAEGLALARGISAPEEERDILLELAVVHEERGDDGAALAAYREGMRIRDAIFDEARARRVEALEAEFRSSQARREIERLRAEAGLAEARAERRRVELLVAVLAALVGLLLYRRRVMAAAQRDLERQVAARTAELSEANARLKELSLTDTLTGLPNRRYFFQAVEAEVSMALRARRVAAREGSAAEQADLVFYVVDLDDFKSVNDGYGHAAGDMVLQQVADVLRETGRASDLVVRWGGEEFLILSRHVDRRGAAHFAERIRQAVRTRLFAAGDGRMLHRTCSLGFAAFPFVAEDPGAVSWETVLGLADQAAYAAKGMGRDAWVGLAATAATVPAEVQPHRDTVAAEVEAGRLAVVSSAEAHGRPVSWARADDGSRARGAE